MYLWKTYLIVEVLMIQLVMHEFNQIRSHRAVVYDETC